MNQLVNDGRKHDQEKCYAGLLFRDFARAFEVTAEVTTYGARKYSPSNWLRVPDKEERYHNALMRHLLADAKAPGSVDPESGFPHLAHAAWNLLAVLEMRLRDAETRSS